MIEMQPLDEMGLDLSQTETNKLCGSLKDCETLHGHMCAGQVVGARMALLVQFARTLKGYQTSGIRTFPTAVIASFRPTVGQRMPSSSGWSAWNSG
ncbi:MAG: hypothetical protein H0T77_03500 [Pyrinomonadaceae bacterium]|nr:hypothetical protein [Pyrinomonadaceae bacterium]